MILEARGFNHVRFTDLYKYYAKILCILSLKRRILKKGVIIMEYFGLLAFVLVMSHMGLPDKVEELNKKVKLLGRHNKKSGGELTMSEMLKELVGKDCTIVVDSGMREIECTVLSVDDEWMKISSVDKKGNKDISIKRIDNIDEIIDIRY